MSGGSSGVVNVAGTLYASGKNSGERGGAVTITGENIALNKGASIDASGAVAGGTVLNAGGGTSVVITTGAAAPNSQAGNITVATNSKINYSGTNAGVGLTLNAHNNIVVGTGTAITASVGKLDVTFNAGKQVSGNGVITLATTSIASNGGNAGANRFGITIAGSTVQATAGGSINVTGVGGDALAIAAGSKLLGAGTLTVQGPTAATTMGVGGVASALFNVQTDSNELITIPIKRSAFWSAAPTAASTVSVTAR